MTSFALEAQLGASVARAESVQSAFDCLLDERPLDLIICEDSAANAKIFKYMLSVGSSVPLVLLGSKSIALQASSIFPDLKILGRYDPVDPVEKLVELLKDLEVKITSDRDPAEAEFCRINTELLLKVVPLQGDIYVRLSSIKFVRLFKKGDVFDANDLTRYFHEKKIDYLYLKRDDCGEFISKFKTTLATIVLGAPLGVPQVFQTAAAIQDSIVELAQSFGFTPELRSIVDQNVKLVIGSVRKNEVLSEVLKHLKKNQAGYLSSHSVVLAHIACCLSTKMAWHSDSTFEKLTFAALMHDIALKKDSLAQIDTKAEILLQRKTISAAEEAQILSHPQAAIDSIKALAALPSDVDTIILQHHERPDGTGFPRGLVGNRIAPLAALFIVAHDIVKAHLGEGLSPAQFVERHSARYPTGTFKRVIDAITTSLANSEDAA